MKKLILKLSKILGIIILIIALGSLGLWWYFNVTFLNFEKDFAEQKSIKNLTLNEYTFSDRNQNGKLDIFEDDRKSIEERVEDLIIQMTLEEKIHLLKGSGLGSAIGDKNSEVPGAVGTIVSTPRLGIPSIYLSDGPAGLRIQPKRDNKNRTYYCTAFPIGSQLASTWNTNVIYDIGSAMGSEAREYGVDVILGPGANIHRHPLCGRNFEYYSEDPFLSGIIGASMINGIESQGVGSAVKHFVANNQEASRNINDAIISDRALREIYLKGFEIIVKKSQPWAIMSSYNKINGTYVAESKDILTDILRGEWDFQGLVMTDWFGGNSAPLSIAAGNDLLEPGTKRQWEALLDAARNGSLSEVDINTSARRILRLILKSKKMESYQYNNNPDLKSNALLSKKAATEGIVLLKNKSALPFKNSKNVALLGVTSYDFISGGTGSGDVNEAYSISLEEGLRNLNYKINNKAKSLYEVHRDNNKDEFIKPEGFMAMFNPYFPPRISYTDQEIKEIVSSSDIGIITIGRISGEGADRAVKDDFLISEIEKNMIFQVCEAYHKENKKVIVVLNIGGVIEMSSWEDKPDAILLAWQGGQEGGSAVAEIISGKENPSGKLPMTFPIELDDHRSNSNFPLEGGTVELSNFISNSSEEKLESEKIKNKDYTNYNEGIYVGYRHFDKEKLEVSYPFGYGMSYSSFKFEDSNLFLDENTIKISLKITNTGEYIGKEVIQVYSSISSSKIDRPDKELRTFHKTEKIFPGNSTVVELEIPKNDLSFWSEKSSSWELEPGEYKFHIGSSSRDIRIIESFEIK